MKIFITGGSGYIGDILAKKLSTEFLIISGSQKQIYNSKKNKRIRYKKINYHSLKSLKNNFKGIDVVIHLVGMNKEECEKNKKRSLIFKEKVTLNIINACKHNGIQKLIYLSSSQIYKDFQNNSINEKSKLDKGNFYSKGHILAEKKILKLYADNFTIIRASNIFGFLEIKKKGEQKKNLVHMLLEDAIKKNVIKIKNPNIIKNFMPVSLLVENIKLILKTNKFNKKIINLGSKSLSLYNLALSIQKKLKTNKKNKYKIRIEISKKIVKSNSKHAYRSLVKKITFSPKLFNIEMDNIINLLTKKTY